MQGIGTVNTAVVSTQEYNSTAMHYWNGTSWAAANARNTAKGGQAAFGAEDAAVLAGGFPSESNITEVYDGTNWTSGNTMNTGRNQIAGAGTQTDGLAFGGDRPPTEAAQTTIESWDGTSWATSPATLATARTRAGAGRNTASGTWIAGGIGPGGGGEGFNVTEEYNKSINTFTAAAWASGGTLNTARQRTGGFGGAQTSAVTAAGATAPPASALNKTEEYNGTSWTEGNAVNTARYNMTAFGTEPAGVLAGVGTPSVTYGGTTEEYNGSTWTTVNPYAAPGVNYRSSNGTLTAGLLAGGVAQAPAELSNAVEEYDGTNWSSANTLPQYQAYSNQAGSQTAAINGGGGAGPAAPGPVSANAISLEYDGTNWTAGPNANLYSDRLNSFNGGSGTQTAAMFVGGDGTGTATYDGTSFATAPNVAAARGETSAAGQAPAPTATIFAGSPVPGVGNTTLEFSGATETAVAKTLTTS
jgi:hypothetical protein